MAGFYENGGEFLDQLLTRKLKLSLCFFLTEHHGMKAY
jgi:hypothetical protein